MQFAHFTAIVIQQLYALYSIAVADKAHHFMSGQNGGSVFARVEHIGGGQAEGVYRAVWHAYRAD